MLKILSGQNLIILGVGLIGAVALAGYLCYTKIDYKKKPSKKTATKKAPAKKTRTTTKKKSTKKK